MYPPFLIQSELKILFILDSSIVEYSWVIKLGIEVSILQAAAVITGPK